MEAINPNAQLVSIFGPPEYNNFNEPVPFSNQPRCLIGFTTAFLVSVLPYHLVVTSRLRWHRCRFAIRHPDLLTPVFCQALSWVFVCFRLYVRLKVARVPGLDDLFVALYLVCFLLPSFLWHVCVLTCKDFNFYCLGCFHRQ